MIQVMHSLENYFLYLTLSAYCLAMVLYWLGMGSAKDVAGKAAPVIAGVGWICNTIILVTRTMAAHRLPLTNGYEFILTFCWGTVLLLLFSEQRFKIKALGAFVMPIPFLLLGFIIMITGPYEKVIQALPPALKSPWLTFHVFTAVFAYGAFAVSAGLAVMYLCKHYYGDKASSVLALQIPEKQVLDELSYKLIVFGFTFLTLVIITGAIWANYAWGSYWSWDPKETWSLITWIIYAGYLHARLMRGWKGERAAWLAVLGFIAVLFTFFGVNYLLPGMHSYA